MHSRHFSRQAAATIATAATLCCVVPLARGFVQHPVTRHGRRAFAGGRGMHMMVKIEDVLKSPKWPGKHRCLVRSPAFLRPPARDSHSLTYNAS